MATRAATFTSKIQNLKDYHNRIVNGMAPQPTGVDVANTLKYFSQTLLSVLKDVPNIPVESYGPRQRDSVRLSVFPNLNYSGLYQAILSIIDLVPIMQIGQLALGEALLNVMGCLVPFLEHDLLDSLPYTVASTLAIFPPTLHKDIISLLCSSLLPMTLGFDGCDEPTYASESAAAIITMIFQHTDNGAFHSQILECFMSMKKNVIKDILSIIAYGPPAARAPAAHLLFYYWPQLNPSLSDRRGIHYKYCAWPPVKCQRKECVNSGNTQAVKMCLNPALAIHSGDTPPPLYICSDCAEMLRHEHSQYMVDLLLPMTHVSSVCENKNCRSENNLAVCTCFSTQCASFNGNRPIRYCKVCHEFRHSAISGGKSHVFHLSVPDIWNCSRDLQRYLMDAIVSLLKDAQPIESKRTVEMGEEHRRAPEEEECFEVEEGSERKLLSRYGIWLLVELCKTKDEIPIEILGRLLGMLFQWFDATAYLPDDNVGNALERLKPEYICTWLREVMRTHFEVIVSCLLPHPVEYARVGGIWDTLATRTTQIKEGLNCLFCLVPYDIITYEIWDYVMPYWLEAIRTEVPEDELLELKVLLSKALDIDMCPLPFNLNEMYHFVTDRFMDSSASVQEQALQWLQILSGLDIIVPMHLLLSMFRTGVEQINSDPEDMADAGVRDGRESNLLPPSSPTAPHPAPLSPDRQPNVSDPHQFYVKETELILPCFIIMLDICLKQMELQESPQHLGIYNETSREVMQLLTGMLRKEWDGLHTCPAQQQVNCAFCQDIALWHQLAAQLMEHICPRDPLKIPHKELPKPDDLRHQPIAEATKESEELGQSSREEKELDYDIQTMPVYLQLYDVLLKCLGTMKDVDAMFAVLSSLKFLVLHGECLNYTISQYHDFIIFTLKKQLIPNLWKLLQAEHSHLATVCVPLLLHAITLPAGADLLWRLIEDDFGNEDWKPRFNAVEKVTVLARCLEVDTIRYNQVIQTSLAHAFCHLISSVEDINTAVAQKTIMYLETIKPSALKCLCQSLEFQFDTVINDRGMILQRMQLLAAALPEQPILSWEFFLNRFDTLSLEAQLDLENSGDISYPQDLTCSDRHSDTFLKKLNRARFALARTDSVRSVSSSLSGKPPYRRAVSVPLHLITKGISPPKVEKEKSCIRQQSAPQFSLGRRMTSSKFNLSSFGNVMFPGGQLREFTDDESNFAALLQRAMDLEGIDRDTVYQLVALLMRFMVKASQGEMLDKSQSVVLRHLNILLGYNQTEKTFSVPPYKLRSSAVFNAFLSNIPNVLDRNFKLGNTVLPITLLLLQYSPSPQRYASDYQPPNYTLWYLEPHTRQAWLMAFLVILYKYQISSSPVSAIIQTLVRLVVNTVDAQHHRCKKTEDGFPPPSPTVHRGKDMGKMSVSDLENIQETETPPQSPSASQASQEEKGGGAGGETVQVQAHEGVVQYLRRQPDGAESSEGMLSDAECTPTLPGGRKNGIRKLAKVRQPRPLVDYSEQESTEDEGKEPERSQTTPLLPKVTPTKQSGLPQGTPEAQCEGGQEASEPGSPGTSCTVEKKMAQQLQEFAASHVENGATRSSLTGTEIKDSEVAGFEGQESGAGEVKATSSSSTTEVSSTPKDGATTSEHSREAVSELDSTEESEKTQTSDADSEKRHGATDSGGEATHEDSKDDLPTKSKSQAVFKANFRKRKERKTGLTTVELQKKCPELSEMTPSPEEAQPSKGSRRARRAELQAKNSSTAGKKTASSRYGDNVVVERCAECQVVLEQYDDDTIGLCVTVLATFIHREPSLATPLLLDMLQCVSSSVMIPGNCVSIARQFLRCVLHQLAPNGIFPMLFQSNFDDPHFWKTMAAALVDFNDLTTHSSLIFLLEGLNETKNFPQDNILLVLSNMSTYLNCVMLESSTPMWTNILGQFEVFFRRLPGVLPSPCDLTSVLRIMISILKIPATSSNRSILEPFSKVLSFAVQNGSFKLQQLLDLCSLGNRAFIKDRDKLFLTRTVVFELVQALKFKSSIPDENLLLLIQFVVLDAGGTICSSSTVDSMDLLLGVQTQSLISTNAADCMRQHLNDCMDFIADLHTLTKVKSNMRGGGPSLNEDTLGSQIKSGISQFLALEISRGNGRDNRAITRYLPWLYHPPSAMQQGPKEFIDCIGHIRLLSWLLIGSLTHTAVMEGASQAPCLPIPMEASAHIADHIMVIMTGFAEQSKASVLHMSSLFHAFILCQLWTMYCESAAAMHPQNSEQHQKASAMVMDFWARVTPGILQLLSHSKVLAEMVNLHFLSLMEALQECNSCILANLFPMWMSILFAYHTRLPGHLHVRLQTCQNWEPPHPMRDQTSFNSSVLLTWLKRSQFKLGQIEVQSSAATQFYTV